MQIVRTIRIIDIDAAGGIDPARLLRAMTLAVRRTERGRYLVHGGAEEHAVDLVSSDCERCDCGDHLLRDAVCKHILACLLREGDERVIAALGHLVRGLSHQQGRLLAAVRGRRIRLTRPLRAAAELGSHPDDLDFRPDPSGETEILTVSHRLSGRVLGTVGRELGRPLVRPVAPQPEEKLLCAA